MQKGKILKVRMGHEANCSSGMVVVFLLMIGGVAYLPLSLITAAVQAAKLRGDASHTRKRVLYWVIPQLLGLGVVVAMLYVTFTGNYGTTVPLIVALALAISFAMSVTAGYWFAPELGYLVLIVCPLVFIIGLIVLLFGAFTIANLYYSVLGF